MSKSSLITILAVIASVSAKPYVYGYGTLSYAPLAAYTAAELYNPAAVAPLPATYSAAYPAGYPAAYSAAYSGYPASYEGYLTAHSTPLFGAHSALSAYGSSYVELATLINPVSPFAPVAPLTYRSPYSYVYK